MTGRPRLVVLDPLFPDLDLERSIAEARGWSLTSWDGDPSSLEGVTAVVHVRTQVDRMLMEGVSSLRVVGRYGTGLDSVDLEAASDLGIVAVGFGTIGRAVSRALLACGLAVRVVTRHGADDARAIGASPVSLEEGLADAGFVFLHAALSAETAGLIDASRIARMSTDAILVDTARLGLIEEAAVALALESGRLAGVALDARLASDSPLRALVGDPRLLVTPHIGWYSERSAAELRRRTIEETIDAAEAA